MPGVPAQRASVSVADRWRPNGQAVTLPITEAFKVSGAAKGLPLVARMKQPQGSVIL